MHGITLFLIISWRFASSQLITSDGTPLLVFKEPRADESESRELPAKFPGWLQNALKAGNLRNARRVQGSPAVAGTTSTTYIAFEDPNSDPNDPLTFVVIEPSLHADSPEQLPLVREQEHLEIPQANTLQLTPQQVEALLQLSAEEEKGDSYQPPTSREQDFRKLIRVPDITFSIPLDHPDLIVRSKFNDQPNTGNGIRAVSQKTPVANTYTSNYEHRAPENPFRNTVSFGGDSSERGRGINEQKNTVVVQLDPTQITPKFFEEQYGRRPEYGRRARPNTAPVQKPEPYIISLHDGPRARTTPFKVQPEIRAVSDEVVAYLRQRHGPKPRGHHTSIESVEVEKYAQPILHDLSQFERESNRNYRKLETQAARSTEQEQYRYAPNPQNYFAQYRPVQTNGDALQKQPHVPVDAELYASTEDATQEEQEAGQKPANVQPNWRYFHQVAAAPSARPTSPALGPYTVPYPPSPDIGTPYDPPPEASQLLSPRSTIDSQESHVLRVLIPNTPKLKFPPAPPPPNYYEQKSARGTSSTYSYGGDDTSAEQQVQANPQVLPRVAYSNPPSSLPPWYHQQPQKQSADNLVRSQPYQYQPKQPNQLRTPVAPAKFAAPQRQGDYSFKVDTVRQVEEVRDYHKYCCFWAKHNQCHTNAEWMMVNCKLACTNRSCPGCEDEDEHCATWAQHNQCTANADFMYSVCRRSCNAC